MIEIPNRIRQETQRYLCLYQDNRLSRDELEDTAKEYKFWGVDTKKYEKLFNQYRPTK